MAAIPGTERLSSLDLQRLHEWNHAVPPPVERTIHEVIQEQCARDPTALAVTAWDGDWSYRELDIQSTRVADQIRSRLNTPVPPSGFIPLYFEKSRWAVVAMIGVWKAGGAFVFLDTGMPTSRLLDICSTIDAQLVLTSSANVHIANDLALPPILVNGEMRPATRAPEMSRQFPLAPHHPACVVFTSGSTGVPKGTVLSHTSLVSSLKRNLEHVNLGPGSRVFQFSSYQFDMSLLDMLLALFSGACVCVPAESDRQADLAGAISRFQATYCNLTPSVARTISPQAVPSMRELCIAGEPLAQQDIDMWVTQVRLLNGYGPSECSLVTTIIPITGPDSLPSVLGRPFATVCWVAEPDDVHQLVPIGTEGELLIEGPPIGQGYLHEPILTAQAWVQPQWLTAFNRPAGTTVYRTGDLVRLLENGHVQIYGRRDAQVKIHGQRLELGEIESYLRRCFAGSPSVVVELVSLRERSPMLVAFVANEGLYDQDSNPTGNLFPLPTQRFRHQMQAAETRLLQVLPAYMVPSLMVPLRQTPRTSSGKTDRRRLRELFSRVPLEAYWPDDDGNLNCPSTPREQLMQRLWSEILTVPFPLVRRNSHWGRLGGNSLIAMRLVGHLRRHRLELMLGDCLRHPVLMDMCQHITDIIDDGNQIPPFGLLLPGLDKDAICEAGHVMPDAVDDIYPCTTTQKLFAIASRDLKVNMTFLLTGALAPDLTVESVEAAWIRVARAHPMLRTCLVCADAEQWMQIVMRDPVPLTVRKDDGWCPSAPFADHFHPGEPLVRAEIVDRRLNLWLHHAAYDLWALGQLAEALGRAARGKQSIPTRPFNTFVHWTGRSTAATASFWRGLLAGYCCKPFPSLPRPDHIPCDTEQIPILLPGAVPAGQIYLAVATALAKMTNETDIVVGGAVARRAAPVHGVREMIAPTLAMLPFRFQLAPSDSLEQNLARVDQVMVDAMEFESLDLEDLHALGNDVARACNFQTYVVVQGDISDSLRQCFDQPEFYHDMRGSKGLGFLYYPSGESAMIVVRWDPSMILGNQVKRIAAVVNGVLAVIRQRPHSKLATVKVELD